MSHVENIGRVAQLCNLIAKPELNKAYVVIESYHYDKDRYGIKTLPFCSPDVKVVHLLVKPANIQFPVDRSFASAFPFAPLQSGECFNCLYQPGTILDFTKSDTARDVVSFNSSCRVIGRTGPEGLPATQFSNPHTLIELRDTDAVIEFLNIDFTNGSVFCAQGENMTFRNCRFGGAVGLVAGVRGRTSATILLESCVFDSNLDFGIIVMPLSRVTVLNCALRDCKYGMVLSKGASAVWRHCVFTDCEMGIDHTGSKAPTENTLDIAQCSFTGGETGLGVTEGGNLVMKHCRFQSCTLNAVAVVGPRRTRALIGNTAIAECGVGIMVHMGKVDLVLENTQIERNGGFGLMLAIDLLGSVSISNCSIMNNEKVDIMNYCGEQCPVDKRWGARRAGKRSRCSSSAPTRRQAWPM